jgi:hypothetical protein
MRSVFTRRLAVLFGLAVALIIYRLEPVRGDDARAKNVVVITLDGFRWQEMFTGADREYFKRNDNGEPGAGEKRFWRPTAEERRSALLPFIWTVIAARGQIFGDPSQQGLSHVTNGLWFSYPGYSEMFTGSPDPRIDSNEKKPNPNVTVLEWLNTRPGFRGRIAAFGAWDVLPSILNVARSGISVGSGFDLVQDEKNDRGRAINQLSSDLPALWGYGPFDAPVVYAALESLRTSRPRVMYIMLGETDEWAHRADYEMYLDAAYRADRFISRVWETLQTSSAYAGKTTLLLTTDHGRGASLADWMNHGREVPAAESTWIAALGPGVPPAGVRKAIAVTTSQLAATIAGLLGEDFQAAKPHAAPPLSF